MILYRSMGHALSRSGQIDYTKFLIIYWQIIIEYMYA